MIWWLCFRRPEPERTRRVLIMDASSLIHARMIAGIEGIDVDLEFVEGHRLEQRYVNLLAPDEVDRMLSLAAARRVLARFEAVFPRVEKRPQAPSDLDEMDVGAEGQGGRDDE